MESEIKAPKNFIILCIDRDNDIGIKAGIETPIMGRDEVFKAAVKLISTDPEEADANTMFESVRILDSLRAKSENENYEVAVVAGSRSGEFDADRKIALEIQKVLKSFPAEAAILVSDGFTDQIVAPIVESYVPIISVRRFAVKHSQSLETSWYIFMRYVRSLFIDPRYTKWTLGFPGVTLLLLTVLYSLSVFYPNFPFAFYTTMFILLLFGSAMAVKGFGIDKAVSALFAEVVSMPYVLVNAFGSISGVVVCLLGVNQGLSMISSTVPKPYLSDFMSFISHTNLIISAFIEGAIDYFIIGCSLIFVGRAIYFFFKRSSKIWVSSVGVVISIAIGETIRKSAPILREVPTNLTDPLVMEFFTWIGLGIAILIGSTLAVRFFKGYFSHKFPNE